MLGEEGGKDATGQHEHGDDVFLKKIESHLLTQVMYSISTGISVIMLACLQSTRLAVTDISDMLSSNKWAITKCIVMRLVSHSFL